MGEGKLTHVDASGAARMVDVSAKDVTVRTATAEGFVRMNAELVAAIRADALKKGDALGAARLAGIAGAKRTSELVPLCHTLALEHADVEAKVEDDGVRLRATARTSAKTGVEMEALTAVAVAALTLVDMGKAIDKAMVVEGVRVVEKRGGRGGDYVVGGVVGDVVGDGAGGA